jgi:hypothetical protein
MIKMNPVQSSNVVAIGHDGKNVMRVQYRGDSFYNFEGVSIDDFNELQKSKSVGSHLHRMGVKGTKIIMTKCPECGKVAMMKVGPDGGDVKGDSMDVDCCQCQSCGNFEPF